MKEALAKEFVTLLENSIEISGDKVKLLKPDVVRKHARKLAEISALNKGSHGCAARYITRCVSQQMGIVPASIHELYMARGTGALKPTFTVPAINLRVMTFDCASAVFRVAKKLDAASILFEIARSEMVYTDQRPNEYTTSILAAAIAEGYRGPVFLQGDHFQVKPKAYTTDAAKEIESLKTLMKEAIAAGWFNIDVDTSTLVDLEKKTIPEQQAVNVGLSSMFTKFLRDSQPDGVTISVGGEIGEVGGHNSTVPELRGYLDGFKAELKKLDPKAVGLSKISIQTGTSHGGVVLPDGTMAKVSVDFNCLKELGAVAREYGLGGAVQHGASTLPEEAFGHFVQYEGLEIHLATNFMNIFYDHIPASMKEEMYKWLDENSASERKPDMTSEQFYYKARKNAVGPFKAKSWNLPEAKRAEIGKAWEDQFTKLFTVLGLKGTAEIVAKTIHAKVIEPVEKDYFVGAIEAEDVTGLAD
jgi:fructose/tagatose bisphosphate aldolase